MKLWLIDDLPVILSTLKQNVDSKERVLQLRLQSRVIVTKLWIKFIVKVNGDSDLTINESEKLMKHLFICNVDADKFWLEWLWNDITFCDITNGWSRISHITYYQNKISSTINIF